VSHKKGSGVREDISDEENDDDREYTNNQMFKYKH
jgi:hypothetical protein